MSELRFVLRQQGRIIGARLGGEAPMPKSLKPKSKSQTSPSRAGRWLRSFLVGILVALSCLTLVAYISVHWVERQILNTDNWVAFVTPLPKQPVIYNALGNFITVKLFEAVPVEQKVAEVLPERAVILAPPLTEEIQKLTEKASKKVVSSDAFQTIWVGANRAAMNRVLTQARSDEANKPTKRNQKFNLDLSQTAAQVREKLGLSSPILFQNSDGQEAPKKKINIGADLKAKRDKLHQYIRGMDFLNAVLPVFVITSLLVALAFSRARRRLVAIFAGSIVGLTLLQLIGVKALRPQILNQIQNSSYKPAVGYIYDSLLKSFNNQVRTILVLALILLIGTVLVKTSVWQNNLRGFLHVQKYNDSNLMKQWHQTRQWFKQNKYYVWLGLLGLTLAYLAFIADITLRHTVNSILVLIGLMAATQIMANPPVVNRSSKRAARA